MSRHSAPSAAAYDIASVGIVALDRIEDDDHAQLVERLDNLDADRSAGEVHPLHAELATGVEAMLHSAADRAEVRVGDVA